MIILFRLFRKRPACLFPSIFVFLCEGPGKWVTALHTHINLQEKWKQMEAAHSVASAVFCIHCINTYSETQHYTKWLVRGGCCDRRFHGLSAYAGSVGQFPDTEQLNTDRSSSLSPSLLVLYLLLHHPHQSISFHLSWLAFSPSRPIQIVSLSPLQFLALSLHSIRLSLVMHRKWLSPLSLARSLPPSYASVHTSVSKRLAVVCCAKASAQIWITAVWRYV